MEEGVGEGRGLAFTYGYRTEKDGVAFVRAGYSRDGGAQMRRFVGGGMAWKPRGRDVLGVATSWGSPPEKELRDQVTSEVFYRVQLTQNITFTPSLAVIYRPSYTLEKTWVLIPGLRMRFGFPAIALPPPPSSVAACCWAGLNLSTRKVSQPTSLPS